MVGGWEMSNVDRDRRCPLSFSVEPAPGGYKIDFDATCPTAFPSLDNVVAWTFGPKDVLRLVDAKGAAVLEFTEVENGMFESERGAEGLLFLQTQASLKVETRTAEQIVGDWSLLREADKPLCRLTLSNTASGDAFRVIVKPGCDKAIATFNPSTWRLDRDQLDPHRAQRLLAVLRSRRHGLGARAAQRRSAAAGATVRRLTSCAAAP